MLAKISDHVYWMPPGPPDRPALAAVVGTRHVLMLDAGASAAHAGLFLDALRAAGIAVPRYVSLTHWHWDHVFGAAALQVPVIAHIETAQRLALLANLAWDDAALDERVVTGEEIAFCAENIKQELPEPRTVQIARPDMVFRDSLDIHLGEVTCRLQHVGGDHAADSSVMHVEPDRVLFLGDCLCEAIYSPVRYFTTRRLWPLLDTLLAFEADYLIEGHNPAVMSRTDFEALVQKMRLAASVAQQSASNEATEQDLDEEAQDLVRAFRAGREFEANHPKPKGR